MDMLVKLYDLKPTEPRLPIHIIVRPINTFELYKLYQFVQQHSPGWLGEVFACIRSSPPSCFVAITGDKIIGFAAYNVTRLGFFGPMGVEASERNKGVGKALLNAALMQMRNEGYAYAVIGGTDLIDYYHKQVGATVIDGSEYGIYAGRLS